MISITEGPKERAIRERTFEGGRWRTALYVRSELGYTRFLSIEYDYGGSEVALKEIEEAKK